MKVGLISINSHTKVLNFASPLHTYAFQQFLFDNGIDNVIIDYEPCYRGRLDIRHPYDFWVANPLKDEKKQQQNETTWKLLYKDREERYDKFQKFVNEHYVKTEECYNQTLLDEKDTGCDIYMCVTDIIWKYNPKNGFDRGFFLACKSMEGKGKIAYAASRGAKKYTKEQAAQVNDFLKTFNYVACREKSLADFVNKETCAKSSIVLDPVFLQPPEFYEKIAEEPKEKGYILIYAVMERAEKLVEDAMSFAKEKNLDVVDISDDQTILYHSVQGDRTTKYNIGVEEWLGYLKNAEYIFTNSFHCCCFSIIFNKEFYVGKRDGDKIDFLLQIFGLTGQKIHENMLYGQNTIDYKTVNHLKDKYIEQSKKFVLEAIQRTKRELKMPSLLKKIVHKKGLTGIEGFDEVAEIKM